MPNPYHALLAATNGGREPPTRTTRVRVPRRGEGARVAADYHFVTTWRVPATDVEIVEILSDAAALPRWWPAVYLDVRVLEPGGPDGVGRTVSLWTKGWLPYTLRWSFRVSRADAPHGFEIEAMGDFVGRGIWTLTPLRPADDPRGPLTAVEYDWRIEARKGLLRRLTPVLRPAFGANHRWAMAQGERSLLLEVARRHAPDPRARAAVPAPPRPTFPHGRLLARRGWGRTFEPDRLASLELRMWKAYYRRQPARLLGLLVLANRAQAGASWPRAILAAMWWTRAAAGFARASGDYERFAPDIARGYRALGLPADVDAGEVARRELRWWVVRREIGLAAGAAAGDAITALYAAAYRVPEAAVAEAGRLRGLAAEVRDRGAAADPDGPKGPGRDYWPEVARLLRESYRELAAVVAPA